MGGLKGRGEAGGGTGSMLVDTSNGGVGLGRRGGGVQRRELQAEETEKQRALAGRLVGHLLSWSVAPDKAGSTFSCSTCCASERGTPWVLHLGA